jgi:cytochrome b involved in lipid metabolism
MGDVN